MSFTRLSNFHITNHKTKLIQTTPHRTHTHTHFFQGIGLVRQTWIKVKKEMAATSSLCSSTLQSQINGFFLHKTSLSHTPSLTFSRYSFIPLLTITWSIRKHIKDTQNINLPLVLWIERLKIEFTHWDPFMSWWVSVYHFFKLKQKNNLWVACNQLIQKSYDLLHPSCMHCLLVFVHVIFIWEDCDIMLFCFWTWMVLFDLRLCYRIW